MLAAEFLGTATLATVAINVSRSQIGIGYFVAIGVGLTLGMLVLALGPVSGGHFNPAVTIGLWTVRKVKTLQAVSYLAAQMLGGLAAWQLANYFVGQELPSVANKSFDWKVLVAEAVGTLVFTFLVSSAVFQRYEGGKAAALIGGGLTIGVIVASSASNAVLNPAVALANQSWSWAYAAGPIVGALIGTNLYVLLFAPVEALGLPRRVRAAEVRPAPVAAKSRAATAKKPAARKSAAKKPAARKRK
ncbi:MAG: aquaporin [Candidatus Saccharimonadales bacterium]